MNANCNNMIIKKKNKRAIGVMDVVIFRVLLVFGVKIVNNLVVFLVIFVIVEDKLKPIGILI